VSNVARHARANRLDVVVQVGDEVVLQVSDDGTGLPAGETRRSGLANLEDRAAVHHGSLTVECAPSGGTRLTWRAPAAGGGMR
jgi:signal transduction histidine kinase